jgi:hypothetical protein
MWQKVSAMGGHQRLVERYEHDSCIIYVFQRTLVSILYSSSRKITSLVVLENNNEHLTRLLAEGLSLFRALLSPHQEVVLASCQEAGPGEPGSAAVQSVRPSAC